MKKQAFVLPETIKIQLEHTVILSEVFPKITYYSDCVFNPCIYHFDEKEIKMSKNKDQHSEIQLDFTFLLELTKKIPKIFDNIGVLKIVQNEIKIRYGVLITKEKDNIYVSLIN